MSRGNFELAWLVSDAVLRARRGTSCDQWPRHEQYIWDGTSFRGKRVLIRCYHGLGDTVQFIRYAPLVKQIAGDVLVWAQPELIPLLTGAAGIDRLIPLHDGAPEAAYDVDVESMELPYVFRTTLATIPREVPYIHLAVGEASVRRRVGHRKARHVGIVWRAGSWDDRRSIPIRLFAPIARIPGVRLHALQQGPALAQWPAAWGDIWTKSNALELAQAMHGLDLLISVDSFPAHLAGALGLPVWTLLHSDPDWRWMRDRNDSPWYPTMRLWRQPRKGDWPSVLAGVNAELAILAAASA